MTQFLTSLPKASLRSLAISLRQGPLASKVTAHAVQQLVGPDAAAAVAAGLQHLAADGWSSVQMAVVAEAIASARGAVSEPESMLDLVLSGPDAAGIPTRDTAAVMHAMIELAQREVILVGYAVHNGKKLFARLAERMQQVPDLSVWFCLNIGRSFQDTSLASEIVRRFAMEFRTKHWPWDPRPRIYFDPRSLAGGRGERASLHAKCLIIDRQEALVTSANFTEAAQSRNIEVGVHLRHQPTVERLAAYFEALRDMRILQPCLDE